MVAGRLRIIDERMRRWFELLFKAWLTASIAVLVVGIIVRIVSGPVPGALTSAQETLWSAPIMLLMLSLVFGLVWGVLWVSLWLLSRLRPFRPLRESRLMHPERWRWSGSPEPSRVATPKKSAPEHFAELWLHNTEAALKQCSPADFETTQDAASVCIAWVSGIESDGWWWAGYDSLDSFYAAHEARHPDIRLYAAVAREIPVEDPDNPPDGTGEEIVRRIADLRAEGQRSPRILAETFAP